ncbi:hypothetical protein N7510_006044 [Penicillium lagena]|uniref:uncharacterized protein n=1 Tax=Penicillium lagena TaxID=94218 RepID=UPI0025402EC0|nr:uncharacterized protein N7510_006044 [Penicillium lagena]KAJ5612850.1 hypothetical protein N7510_006044 [Penicillium lagena]
MEQYDVAVIGLGVLGSAAAYHAAQKGAKVLGLEQFELGHTRGASHDTSRIVRTSNFLPEYVSLAKSAYKDWAALEKAVDQHLLSITGGVVFFPDEEGASMNAADFTSSLDANDVPYELLDAAQVKTRWPQFDIADSVKTVYTADTGIVHASKVVTAMQYVARGHGAVLKDRTPVERVTPHPSGKGVIISTATGQEFHAAKAILTTDAWTNTLLAPLGVHIPLSVMQEQITYFKPTDVSSFESSKFPVWIWGGRECYYGFPCYGETTIKAGRDVANNFMTPAERTFVHSPRLLGELCSFMDSTMPDSGREALRTVTCQYTITPDRQFIISPLETCKDVILGLGAAHAFKFAPAFGRVLAELAIDGVTKEDISTFGIPKSATCTSKL